MGRLKYLAVLLLVSSCATTGSKERVYVCDNGHTFWETSLRLETGKFNENNLVYTNISDGKTYVRFALGVPKLNCNKLGSGGRSATNGANR